MTTSMKIYNLDENGFFTGVSEAILDELETEVQGEKRYLLPNNATFVAPNVEYDPSIEQVLFNKSLGTWTKVDIKIVGDYYLKTSGEKASEILTKDINKYTTVEPTLEINTFEGVTDKIEFNENTKKWTYSSGISKTTFETLRKDAIATAKYEANTRILNSFPDYKQHNLTAAVCLIHNKEIMAQKANEDYVLTDEEKATIRKASQCNDFILMIREKSNALEAIINSCSTLEELSKIDISADIYWN